MRLALLGVLLLPTQLTADSLVVRQTLLQSAIAQDGSGAKAVIVGPSGGVPGDILVLDASESQGDHFDWIVEPAEVNDKPSYLILEDGKKCLVCSVPGSYTIVLGVSSPEGISLTKWGITVGGDIPKPNPKPNPNPEPEPYKPVKSKYGLVEIVRVAKRKVPSPASNRIQAVADAFESVASQVGAGAITTIPNMFQANKEETGEAIGEYRDEWTPTMDAIKNALSNLNTKGELQSLDQHREAWLEISQGFNWKD